MGADRIYSSHVAAMLDPVVDLMGKTVLQSKMIHTDATKMPFLDPEVPGKTRSGQMWAFVGDHIIKDGTHLRIARDRLHAEKGGEIERIVAAFIVESQQGRGFQGEESKPRQQRVHQRNIRSLTVVWDVLKRGADGPNQAVGTKMLPFIQRGQSESLRK